MAHIPALEDADAGPLDDGVVLAVIVRVLRINVLLLGDPYKAIKIMLKYNQGSTYGRH